MRGPAITLPEPAASKLAELTLARDAALDAGRSAQTRANNLPASRQRPCRRAAEKCDELAPFHSIISSARTRSVNGTVMPSALRGRARARPTLCAKP